LLLDGGRDRDGNRDAPRANLEDGMSYDDWSECADPGYDPGPGYTACRGCGEEYPSEELGAEWCCSDECREDYENGDAESFGPDYFDAPRFTGEPGFANPGGNSALRAASAANPRSLPCPNCGAANRLTPADKARGYQCDPCADRAEMGGY